MREYHIIADRPTNVPQTWEIHNAPRPLAGQTFWQGDFIHGVFYAAFAPDDQFAEMFTKTNGSLDAYRLTYYTEAQAREELKKIFPRYADKIALQDRQHVIELFSSRMNKR